MALLRQRETKRGDFSRMGAQLLTSRRTQIAFLLALLVGALCLLVMSPPFIAQMRESVFDRYNRLMPRENNTPVVIVGLDQASTKKLGKYPIGRDMMGDATLILAQAGAKATALDMTFVYRDPVVSENDGKDLDGKPLPVPVNPAEEVSYNDLYFAREAQRAGNVVLGFLTSEQDRQRSPPVLENVVWQGGRATHVGAHFFANQNYIGSFPVLAEAMAGHGFVNHVREADGVLRHFPLMMSRTNTQHQVLGVYPSLTLETLRVALGGEARYTVTGSPRGGIDRVAVGSYSIPTNSKGVVRIYYAGKEGRTYIPFWQVVEKGFDPALVKDKIVLIGAMSENRGDVKPSPLNLGMQGVEGQAELIEQVLGRQFLTRGEWMVYVEAALTFGFALLVIFLAQELNALVLAGFVAAFSLAGGIVGALAYRKLGWMFDPVGPALVATTVFMLAAILAALRTKIISNEKSRFLALMSHEIRTPMTGILGMIEFMKDPDLSRAEQMDFVNTISECSKTLLNTLNDILDVSKLEEGKLEISTVNFDLHAVLRNSADVLGRMARDKGLKIDVEILEGVPQHLHGDPHRMQQIVMNLMNNAIKFTSKGGITVHAEMKEVEGKPILRVEVRDTGIGISEKNMKKLFKGFSQADNSIARKYGGTGLGLSIAKDLLVLMGGQVGVESVEGEGSTFWFELPYLAPVAAEAEEEENIEIAPLRVLLAEDNKVNQQVAMRLLTNKGHSVAIADDGVSVVQMVQESDYDMILMDMNMPVKSGIDAAREIRDMGGKYAEMPIIALTANVVDEYVKKCYDAGMNAHVAKPFSPRELYRMMAKFAPESAQLAPGQAEAEVVDPFIEKLSDNLKEIYKQLGADYLNEYIRNSLAESTRLLQVAQKAQGAGDMDGLAHAVHDLKNASGMIGLSETARLAALVEALCRNREMTALPDIMHILADGGGKEIRRMERTRGIGAD